MQIECKTGKEKALHGKRWQRTPRQVCKVVVCEILAYRIDQEYKGITQLSPEYRIDINRELHIVNSRRLLEREGDRWRHPRMWNRKCEESNGALDLQQQHPLNVTKNQFGGRVFTRVLGFLGFRV